MEKNKNLTNKNTDETNDLKLANSNLDESLSNAINQLSVEDWKLVH
jgi:hypothetical protein